MGASKRSSQCGNRNILFTIKTEKKKGVKMKKQPIVWFYPVWTVLVFIIATGLLFFLKSILLLPIGALLIVSEIPVFLYKKRVISLIRSEMNSFVFYILGIGVLALSLMFKYFFADSYGLAMLVGLVAGFLVYFKAETVHSYLSSY